MNEETESAEIELDYGIGRIYVKGDENTSFEEVVDEFNKQKETMNETIRELKEFDYELRDEYETDTPNGPGLQ